MLTIVNILFFFLLLPSLCHVSDNNGADVEQKFSCPAAFSNFMKGRTAPCFLLYVENQISPDEIDSFKYSHDGSVHELSTVFESIIDFKSRPLLLQHLCQLSIRRNLSENVQEKLQQLAVPNKLKMYLNFSDLFDIPPQRTEIRNQFHDTVVSMLDLTNCGLQALEVSYLCRQVRDAVIEAARPEHCTCSICTRLSKMEQTG